MPAAPVLAPHDLPGFARSTVDGYAVRAADTYGASEGLPSYLEVAGEVAMGAAARVDVSAGGAVAVPTGAVLPEGADAVVMVEHTQAPVPGTLEVVRPVAPGEGVVRADEDARAGAEIVAAGRPLRAQDLGLLAAAGVVELAVHARPRVAIVSTGDEVVDPATPVLEVGQVRDASAVALAALVRQAGGEPVPRRDRARRPRCARGGAARARWPRPTSSSCRPAPRWRAATRPRPPWPRSARPASGATAWRSSRASRRCWPSAAASR